MPAMRKFRLKHGSHSQGGEVYDSRKNNIVESDVNLAQLDSARWEVYDGPTEAEKRAAAPKDIPPPGPPTANDLAMAFSATPMTLEQKKKHAELLRMQADLIDKEAELRAEVSGEEATAHVRESFAASDNAKLFEEEGRKRMEEADEEAKRGVDDGLDGKTVAELKEVAEKEELTIPSGAHKADIIDAIRKGRNEAE